MTTPATNSAPVRRERNWLRTALPPRVMLVAVTATVLLATAGLGLLVVTDRGQHSVSQTAPVSALQRTIEQPPIRGESGPGSPYPPDLARARACGAIGVIDTLSADEFTPERAPGQPAPQTSSGRDLIGYADALNAIDRKGLSTTMGAAITAHASAITNLGAMIGHHADAEDIRSMAVVVETTRTVLREFCFA